MNIKSKLPVVGATIFTVMYKLAQDHNVINLSQSFPDFEPDDALLDIHSFADKNVIVSMDLSMQKLNEFREYFPAGMDSDQFSMVH